MDERGILPNQWAISTCPNLTAIHVSARWRRRAALLWLADSKTRGAADWCHRQTSKKTLTLQNPEPRNRGNDLFARPTTPRPVQHGGGVELVPYSNRSERPS